jgi:hypothetical protein
VYDVLDQLIISVALVKPRVGVFQVALSYFVRFALFPMILTLPDVQENVRHLLAVATPVEVHLLALSSAHDSTPLAILSSMPAPIKPSILRP